ncbi:monocarboxylate transporter 12-B-like isoform X2 [Cebidichthys violaceus]|uniref:monocarboxylate transporter 12-B-like isoform X2 n=1 Tax=Cebidichthys violaceus TaxID=271503 RepID=UPI0035CB4C58
MAVITEEKLEGGRRVSGVTPPPEGGWGWMIVAGCFLSTICIRAVTRCVSMFFVEFQLHFEKDYSSTAWIHSLIDCTTMLCAPLGGFLVNRLSCRVTVMLGGLLSSAGLVLSSFASSLEFLYVSLGVITVPLLVLHPSFSSHQILNFPPSPGSGIGTFVLAPAVQLLIERYSWRGALLILGGLVSNLCVCGALMRPLEPRGRQRMLGKNKSNLENDCTTTESKDNELKSSMETRGLLISNGALANFKLENNKLAQGNIALLLLPSLSPPDPNVTDLKIAECILFSNKLTETMLAGIGRSDPELADETLAEDSKLVESMNLNNVDTKIEDSGLKTSPAESLASTKTSSRGHCLSLESKEEYGFLLIPDFLVLSVSFLFLAYGCSAPVVYLVPYGLSVGLERQRAAFLMSIFGVSGIVGNITFGWITDRKCLKRYRMLSYVVAIGMEGLCCMFLHLLHSFSLLVPFSLLYGYFDGAYVALIPVVTSDVVGSSCLTSALGVVYFLHAIPYLISPPIGGWLVDRTGDYAATFSLSGASLIFSSAVLAAAMLVRHFQKSGARSSPAAQLSLI